MSTLLPSKKSDALHNSSEPVSVVHGRRKIAQPQTGDSESNTGGTEFEWHLDQGGEHSYLMLKGGRHVLNTITKELEQHGFSDAVSGRSYHPANNGLQYDMFVRVTGTVENKIDSLKQFLGNFRRKAQPETARVLPPVLSPMDQVLAQLRAENAQLHQELVQLKELLQGELGAKDKEHTELLTIVDKENQTLKEMVRQFEQEQSARARDLDALKKQSAQQQEKIERFEQNELERNRLPRRFEQALEKTIECLLPNLELLRGSVSVLSTELKNFSDAMLQLRLLNERAISKSKSVGGARAWREIHFSTGESDAGRIYYAGASSKTKTRVLVSLKQNQIQDIKYLKQSSNRK